ncbi:unnamed protein product [Amoebophrya sp. A120]|nr:unnamed protein product [Amoebophrya sp. A120]|eukprot:GSA120T00004477001.1
MDDTVEPKRVIDMERRPQEQVDDDGHQQVPPAPQIASMKMNRKPRQQYSTNHPGHPDYVSPHPCLCGSKVMKFTAREREKPDYNPSAILFYKCWLCKTKFHTACVKSWYQGQKKSRMDECEKAQRRGAWVCPRCRLKHVDPFMACTAQAGKIQQVERQAAASVGLASEVYFDLPPDFVKNWRDKKDLPNYAWVIKSVRCDDYDLNGPNWPYEVKLLVNGVEHKKPNKDGRPTEKPMIPPPDYGHSRKECDGINLTTVFAKMDKHQLTNPNGLPKVRLTCRFYNGSDKLEDGEPSRMFLMGFYLCEKKGTGDLRKRVLEQMIKNPNYFPPSDRQRRLTTTNDTTSDPLAADAAVDSAATKSSSYDKQRILQYFKRMKSGDEDGSQELLTTSVSVELRSISLVCPISGAVQDTPMISQTSEKTHLQTFDMDAFLESQRQIQNPAKRWKCPNTRTRCHPFDLRFCGFTKKLINTAERKAALKLLHIRDAKHHGKAVQRDADTEKLLVKQLIQDQREEVHEIVREDFGRVIVHEDGTTNFAFDREIKKEHEMQFGGAETILSDDEHEDEPALKKQKTGTTATSTTGEMITAGTSSSSAVAAVGVAASSSSAASKDSYSLHRSTCSRGTTTGAAGATGAAGKNYNTTAATSTTTSRAVQLQQSRARPPKPAVEPEVIELSD